MRKIYLIRYALQFRYLRLLLVSIILPALFVGSCLYYFIFTVLEKDLGIPEVISAHLLPVIHKIDGILLIGLPIIIILLGMWSLILCNQLVGPIERMKKEIGQIIKEKDFSRRIEIRKDDVLKPIAEEVNMLLEELESKS